MRPTHRRLRFSALAAFGVFLAALPGAFGQKVPFPIKKVPGETDSAKEPAKETVESLTLPEDRDAKLKFKAVLDYLDRPKAETVPWDVVCDVAQGLLDAKSDSFYPIEGKKGAEPKKRYLSIKDQTNKVIGEFPKVGRQFYQATFGPSADALVKDAIENGYDKPKLAEASQRYFHTKGGGLAALLIAGLNLEAGNYAEAAYGFDRLRQRPDSDDLLTPRTLFKTVIAFKRSGDPRYAAEAAAVWADLEKKFPRDGLVLGRKAYSLDDLKKEMDRPVEMLFGKLSDEFVAGRYGNASHTGVGDGGTPFLDPQFSVKMRYRTEELYRDGADWVKEAVIYGVRRMDQAKGQVALPGFFPVTAPNLILYRTYDGVYAVVSKEGFTSHGRTYRAGELLWSQPATGSLQSLMTEPNSKDFVDKGTAQNWWTSYWQRTMPTLAFENAQVGSLSHDGKLVYFIDDIAIPPLPQMFNGGFPQQPGMTGVRGTEFSRLVAVNIDNGKRAWSLGGLATAVLTEQEEEKTTNAQPLTENAIFLGPPLPHNGRLYILYERNSQIKLACLDPHKLVAGVAPPANGKRPEMVPELLWVQNLGAPNTRLAQDSLRRIQPAYLTYADGVLLCPTNCGAVIAVDINARSLKWAKPYNTAVVAAADPNGGFNPRFGRRPGWNGDPNGAMLALPNDRWRAAAPIVTGGKVVFTAHDADRIICYDLRTGDELWSAQREKDDLYVGGVINGKVLVVGKEAVRAYDLNGDAGKAVVVWQNLRIGTPCGHGVASKDGLYFIPMIGDADNKNNAKASAPQVWAIDVDAGIARSKTAFRKDNLGVDPDYPKDLANRLALGNLVFHDGMMFSQSASHVSAFPLIELKMREMTRLLEKNPKDPVGLFSRGELLLDNGKIKDAIADFKEAEKNGPPDEIRRGIRNKLYLAYTEILRNDFAAGEPVLAEYKTLCELPIDSDDPVTRQQLMDEQVRRVGLYLSLVAKGREKQGRLTDAFDHYRAFAALGDNKQLVAIFDEPNNMTRPDVWARGKIDAMIRNAKDPAIRKPLEDRVDKDWEGVRGSNDLGRLREFVKVFGPYFAAGREAQLLLAEKLLTTNNDDDIREAQVQLMQLWATAEDQATAAQAVESLARVMTRRGLLEDAVGLYSQLGTKYADVVVRDGKTGADIYGDLITDKRLLPYLEPARGSGLSRYKVEQQNGQPNRAMINSYPLEPDGELLQFFRRYKMILEHNQNDNSLAVRVTDRVTGDEWCKFGGLNSMLMMYGFFQQNGQNGSAAFRISQASGHLVLLHLGQFVYCFDVAEKRKLWEYNLLGNTPMTNGPQMSPEGDEFVITYPDEGWKLRLGRSAVLQPTYAALLTRDGLVAVDPRSGQKLWQRSNVSLNARVFGDARHIFLVEGAGAGASSKILRAVDGSVIENTPDFAAQLTGPARLAVLGRTILLQEGGNGQARTLRLYDPLTGTDVWKHEAPATSLLLKTLDPELTGFLNIDGTFEVFASRTGKSLYKAGVDADRADAHLKDAAGKFAVLEPLLLTDAERFYLFLNRTRKPQNQQFGVPMMRTIPVNGVAYGFDRVSGKRLWFTERLFENQTLILDRFDELPALIAASTLVDETNQQVYKVAVLDKQAGKLKFFKGLNWQNGIFNGMFFDAKTKSVELWRWDTRVRIVPDDEAK